MNKTSNHYDKLSINIDDIFEKKKDLKDYKSKGLLKRLFIRYISAVLIKLKLYETLVEIGLIKGWFDDFKEYWHKVLNGRPLYLHDFYFLLGNYRVKFSNVETPDYASNEDFLDSWQNDHTIYLLFGAVRRFSRVPLISRQYEKFINHNDSILEYGCGLAPITSSLLRVGKKQNLSFTIADIRQINFHYAKFQLGQAVKSFEITPNLIEDLPEKYNAVILITVMEHLPNPLATIKNLTKSLQPGGILFFDYHADDAHGQDTIEAVDQKKDVLDFISKNFEILKGNIDYKNIMEITVARKIN